MYAALTVEMCRKSINISLHVITPLVLEFAGLNPAFFHSFILSSVLQQVHSLFQSELSIEWEIVLPSSIPTTSVFVNITH